jgi:hypothetical protein
LVCEKQRLPRRVFRRSIAWLSDWLSTLRRTGYPRTTQDSLPAAGQALPDGLSTRRTLTKGFRFAFYISSSFPKLAWRNHIDRGSEQRCDNFGQCYRIDGKMGTLGDDASDCGKPRRSITSVAHSQMRRQDLSPWIAWVSWLNTLGATPATVHRNGREWNENLFVQYTLRMRPLTSVRAVSTAFVRFQWGNGSHCRECLKAHYSPLAARASLPQNSARNQVRTTRQSLSFQVGRNQ